MGHDSVNRWILVETRAKRLGVYGKCGVCGGEGELPQDAEAKALYEAWTPSEPPSGEGYQLWETTSEGSPLSPVFGKLDVLCDWLENGATVFGNEKVSAGKWREMLGGEADAPIVHQEGNLVFL